MSYKDSLELTLVKCSEFQTRVSANYLSSLVLKILSQHPYYFAYNKVSTNGPNSHMIGIEVKFDLSRRLSLSDSSSSSSSASVSSSFNQKW